jgi:cell division protein FtsW (lipid II flippase)
MRIIVLFIAAIIESAFAVYCIRYKSNQKRTRSIVSIGIFALFIVFALVSIIKWSFRWYALAALLFVWAVLGALSLMKIKKNISEEESLVKPYACFYL